MHALSARAYACRVFNTQFVYINTSREEKARVWM